MPAAAIISPANGATLIGSSQTFTWNAAASADLYDVWRGSAPGLTDLGQLTPGGTTALSVVATGLPTNGTPVYFRLYTRIATVWYWNDSTYTAAPRPQASFSHTNGSIIFTRGPLRPDRSLDVIQPQRQTAGGIPFGYAQTIVAQILRLPLRMTTAQKDQLLAFFNTIVNGMAEIFTYTDTSGAPLSVRFAIPRLDNITEKAFGSWETTVELRVAP